MSFSFYRMDAKKNESPATSPQENIQRKTLQILGICSKLQYRRTNVQSAVHQITTITNEIECQATAITQTHQSENMKLNQKNRELAKRNYELKKQLKDVKEQLQKAQEALDVSNASLDELFNFDEEEDQEPQNA